MNEAPLSESQKLAQAAAATTWSELPTAVQDMALDLLVDALSFIAAGSGHADMDRLARVVKAADGPCTALGDRRGVAMREAIMLNAAATTVLQRQDGYSHAKGHPSAQLTPLLLAIAERDQLPAHRMLSAFVAGYEIAGRVGIAMNGVPHWLHDLGNWANIGLAAAAAHLLTDGDAVAIERAMQSASALGLAFDRYTTAGGATSHHLYPAMTVTQALTAAEGAAAGMTTLPDSLTRFFGPRFGADFARDKLTQGIGADGRWSDYEILNGYFKLHPSCAHLQGVNDAVDLLIKEEGITEAEVDTIDIAVFADAMAIDTATPQNDLAARFSARATVAAAIRYGKLDDPGLNDLAALAPLMARMTVRHDTALDVYTPEGRPGVVKLRKRDGTLLTREVIYPRGTPKTPATPAEYQAKARGLLARHYGAERVGPIITAARGLGQGKPVEELSRALRG